MLGPLVGDIPLPGTLIHYRTPGLTYESGLEVGTSLMFDGGRLMKRGRTREVWNTAVIGPSFLLPGGNRTGDKLTFSGVGLFSDGGAGRTGSDTAATGTATLAKDGQVLATADLASCWVYEPEGCELRAGLPAGRSSYTLTAAMRRQVPHSALSTGVESVWTFPSATTAKEQPLPLTAVRYSPGGPGRLEPRQARQHDPPARPDRAQPRVRAGAGDVGPAGDVRGRRRELAQDPGRTHRLRLVRHGAEPRYGRVRLAPRDGDRRSGPRSDPDDHPRIRRRLTVRQDTRAG
jgi:hypothetical protein